MKYPKEKLEEIENKKRLNLNQLDLNPHIIDKIKKAFNIEIIGELLSIPKRLFETNGISFAVIKNAVADLNLLFDEDYDFFKNLIIDYDSLFIVIDVLDLSKRTINALKRANIYYLFDLLLLNKKDIKKIRGIGNDSISELLNCLNQYGIYLNDDEKSILESKISDETIKKLKEKNNMLRSQQKTKTELLREYDLLIYEYRCLLGANRKIDERIKKREELIENLKAKIENGSDYFGL